MSADILSLWVVTHNPKDFPGMYVARETLLGPHGEHRVSEAALVASTLSQLRDKLPEGLHRMARWAEDDPVIIEVWL